MKKNPLKFLTNWARAILLALSLIAMLTSAIWIFAPNVVDKVDTLFVGAYESYYKHHFKVSHQKYVKISNGNGKRVSDVVNDWGFWHMGQFAADYRKLFGELPSETLG